MQVNKTKKNEYKTFQLIFHHTKKKYIYMYKKKKKKKKTERIQVKRDLDKANQILDIPKIPRNKIVSLRFKNRQKT